MKEFWENLKFVWIYAKDQKWKLIKYIIANIITIVFSIIVPILSAKKIVSLTNNVFIELLGVASVLFLIEQGRNLINYLTSYYTQVIYRETFTNFQTDIGKSILKLNNECLESNSSGVFIQRMTNDTSKLSDIFSLLTMRLTTIFSDIGIFIAIFIVNKIYFIVLILLIMLKYLIEKKRLKIIMERQKEYRKKNEKVTGLIGELVRGVFDIKMLNAEKSFISELHGKITDLNIFKYNMESINRKFYLLRGFVSDITSLITITLLGFLAFKGLIDVSIGVVLLNYTDRVTWFVNTFVYLLEDIKDFNLSASRVISIMKGNEFKKEEFGTKHLETINGNFEFKNVYFSYGKEKVLKGLSFKVNANETVAFVGKSGAGKTTIFNLLCKMYEPNKGTITIDGINIKKLDKETIRGNITIISQNPYIFNMTIRENLKLVKEDLTIEDMISACKLACLHDYIMTLPDKYDTMIGEGGINLSGGQKQRLAIARAFIQKTEIILFDEATSALDNETQNEIGKSLENMKKEYTILIIAHRLSTIINADRIYFINNGKIESMGTHKELLKSSKEYRNLYEKEIKTRN